MESTDYLGRPVAFAILLCNTWSQLSLKLYIWCPPPVLRQIIDLKLQLLQVQVIQFTTSTQSEKCGPEPPWWRKEQQKMDERGHCHQWRDPPHNESNGHPTQRDQNHIIPIPNWRIRHERSVTSRYAIVEVIQIFGYHITSLYIQYIVLILYESKIVLQRYVNNIYSMSYIQCFYFYLQFLYIFVLFSIVYNFTLFQVPGGR